LVIAVCEQARKSLFFMIEDPVSEHREVTEAVFTAADLDSGSSGSKRAKVYETLLNILEGRVSNSNTRKAYKAAWRSFFAFCSEYKLELDRATPYHVEMWLKRHTGSVATQRQHLAAVRLLFDHLLEKGVVDINPAARAKAARLERESAHTTIFEQNEIKAFLEAINLDSLIGKRDKALCSVLLYSWARMSAVVALRVGDYYERKGERWVRLHQKPGKFTRSQSTQRLEKPSTSGFLPPVLDHIPLLLFSRRLGKQENARVPAFGPHERLETSCRPEPTQAHSRNEWVVIVSEQQE
jgi:integrase